MGESTSDKPGELRRFPPGGSLRALRIDTVSSLRYCIIVRESTAKETELAIAERLSRNRHQAEMRQLYANIKYAEALDGVTNPIEMQCVICGAPMRARRVSKKTCSARCRLKLSRVVRACRALPKAEQRKRGAEVKRRWRRTQAAAREEEKRKRKRSLDEITAEIKELWHAEILGNHR